MHKVETCSLTATSIRIKVSCVRRTCVHLISVAVLMLTFVTTIIRQHFSEEEEKVNEENVEEEDENVDKEEENPKKKKKKRKIKWE